jgi:hypothetical protein
MVRVAATAVHHQRTAPVRIQEDPFECVSPINEERNMARNLTIRQQRTATKATGASLTGLVATGARLFGPSEMAPITIAACAAGAIAIGRLAIADAVMRKLRAGEVEIRSLARVSGLADEAII